MVALMPFTPAMISFITNWGNILLYYESTTTKTSYLHDVRKAIHTQQQYMTEKQQRQNREKT